MKRNRLAIVLAVVLLSTAPVCARDDGGQKYIAPPEIVATLPKICWWLYMDNIPNTSEYNILDCGAFSNHYCPAIVGMKKAETEKHLGKRLDLLKQAKWDFEYTLSWTKDIPECSVRTSAMVNIQKINFELDMIKIKLQHR